MNDQQKLSSIPWFCPVPVKKSDFTSLKRSGEKFNIQTDLGRIGSFRPPQKPIKDSELIYSDLQIGARNNVGRRLGSGRSGVYAGKYLKGIGLTSLAANWNDQDGYHNTGHMLPSAAIREYIITCYANAKNIGSSIVQCEGLLLRPLPKEMAQVPDKIFNLSASARKNYRAKVDFRLQAITYKEANFTRASNLVWFLQNTGSSTGSRGDFSLLQWLELFGHFLNPLDEGKTDMTSLQPIDFVKRFEETIKKTFLHFEAQFHAGIYWGSFNNNYSLDGRFLDLEVPLFLGGPCIGRYAADTRLEPSGPYNLVGGFELIVIMEDFKALIHFLISRLSFLIETKAFHSPAEIAFCREFRNLLKKQFLSKPNWLFQRDRQMERIEKMWGRAFDLSTKQEKYLRRILRSEFDSFSLYKRPKPVKTNDMPMPFLMARPEPNQSDRTLHVLDFLHDQTKKQFEELSFINELVRGLEVIEAVEPLLDAINVAERKIRNYCVRN